MEIAEEAGRLEKERLAVLFGWLDAEIERGRSEDLHVVEPNFRMLFF